MYKKLHRSRQNKVIAGVAGGLADYYEIDPVLIRVLFIISVFFSYGTGVIAYIILWIIVPQKTLKLNMNEEGTIETPISPDNTKERKMFLGIVLIIIGGLFLLKNLLPFIDFHFVWPMFLIIIGGFILYRTISENTKETAHE